MAEDLLPLRTEKMRCKDHRVTLNGENRLVPDRSGQEKVIGHLPNFAEGQILWPNETSGEETDVKWHIQNIHQQDHEDQQNQRLILESSSERRIPCGNVNDVGGGKSRRNSEKKEENQFDHALSNGNMSLFFIVLFVQHPDRMRRENSVHRLASIQLENASVGFPSAEKVCLTSSSSSPGRTESSSRDQSD